MASAILTTSIFGEVAPEGMPSQALVAILTGGIYQLTYRRTFDGLAPSLASAIIAGAALQASPDAQSVIVKTLSVNLNAGAATTLYTVPTGFIFIPYRIVIRNASVSLTMASISFGFNSTAFNDVVADATYTELTGATLETAVFPKAGAAIGVAADLFKVKVNTVQGAAATAIINVLGYLVEV